MPSNTVSIEVWQRLEQQLPLLNLGYQQYDLFSNSDATTPWLGDITNPHTEHRGDDYGVGFYGRGVGLPSITVGDGCGGAPANDWWRV